MTMTMRLIEMMTMMMKTLTMTMRTLDDDKKFD